MLDSPEYNDFVEKSKEYNLIPIYQEIRADLETPLSIYIKLSDNKYSFLLSFNHFKNGLSEGDFIS